MTKIIRTLTRAEGGITDAEREAMAQVSEEWIAIARRTDPVNHDEITDAIHRLYAAADLDAPRVVVARDPAVLVAAYGAAAWIWHCRSNESNATRAATRAATDAATDAATYAATYAATGAATRAATNDATYAATNDATYDATDAATRAATDAEGHFSAALAAARSIAGDGAVSCASRWWRGVQGGAYWAANEAYLTAARDVLGLRLPEHEKYKAWEDAARAAPFRIMHEKFCMVLDFPRVLKWDEDNQPHCENGPSHEWEGGLAFYHWHGVRVPGAWIESPDTVDPAEILATENVEQRAAGVAIIGMKRLLDRLDTAILDHDENPAHGDLLVIKMPGLDRPGRYLRAECPRNGTIVEGVPYEDENGRPIETVRHAQAWRVGLSPEEFRYPEIRT